MLTSASDASRALLLTCRLRTLQTAPQPSPQQRPPDLPRPPSTKRAGGQGSAALGSAGGGSVGSASVQDLRRAPSTRLGLGSRTSSRRHSASFSQVHCLVGAVAARQRCTGPCKAIVPASKCFGPGRMQRTCLQAAADELTSRGQSCSHASFIMLGCPPEVPCHHCCSYTRQALSPQSCSRALATAPAGAAPRPTWKPC